MERKQNRPEPGAATKEKHGKCISELKNLPVLRIEDGQEIGKISGFLIDFKKSELAGFIVKSSVLKMSVAAAPFAAISRFGTFAVTMAAPDAITDISENQYLMELYKRDISIEGAKVHTSGAEGRTVGFVKDLEFGMKDGRLRHIVVSNDTGFTSPYTASIPVADIDDAEKNKVILKPGIIPMFRGEGPLSQPHEGKTLVPLVLKESEWRAALSERVAEEMEKLSRRLKDMLEADFTKFFLLHEKESLRNELAAESRAYIELLTVGKKQDSGPASPSPASSPATQPADMPGESEIFGALYRKIAEMITSESERLENRIISINASLNRSMEDIWQRFETDQKPAEGGAPPVIPGAPGAEKIFASLEKKVKHIEEELSLRQIEFEEKLNSRIISLDASLQEFDRKINKSLENLKQKLEASPNNFSVKHDPSIDNLTKKVSALESRLAEIESVNKAKAVTNSAEKFQNDIPAPAPRVSPEEINRIFEKVYEKLSGNVSELKKDFDDNFARVREELDSVSTGLFDDLEAKIIRLINSKETLEQKLGEIQKELTGIKSKENVRPEASPLLNVSLSGDDRESLKENLLHEIAELAESALAHVDGRFAEFREKTERRIEQLAALEGTIGDLCGRNEIASLINSALNNILFQTDGPEREKSREPEAAPAVSKQPQPAGQQILPGNIGGVEKQLAEEIIGKRMGKDIFINGNEYLIRAGEIIDAKVFLLAKEHGKLIEISVNCGIY